MSIENEATDSLTKSLANNPRAGGPDNTREAADESSLATGPSNTPRAGGPDNTRQADQGQDSSTAAQLPNTPRNGPENSRDA